MIYNNISNEEVLNLYFDYQSIKRLISELKDLKNYLTENKIIKQSNNYIVMEYSKFTYDSYRKYRNILLKDFITQNQINFLTTIYTKTINDDPLDHNIDEEVKDIFGFFKFSELYEIKKKLKVLIVYKINNT